MSRMSGRRRAGHEQGVEGHMHGRSQFGTVFSDGYEGEDFPLVRHCQRVWGLERRSSLM